MKPISFAGLIILFLCLFCSCQKEIENYAGSTDSTSTSNNSFLVTTYSEDLYALDAPDQHVKDSFKLSYDNKDRQTSLASFNSANGLKLLSSYPANNQIVADLYEGNALSTHEIIYLNSFGYLDSTYQYSTDGDTSSEKYLYNVSRQLVQLNSYDYSRQSGFTLSSVTTYEYNSDGDKVKETEDGDVTTYGYASHTINNLNTGMNYINASKHLPDTETHNTGGSAETVTHTYTFDNQNRLTMDKATLSSGYVAIKRYTY